MEQRADMGRSPRGNRWRWAMWGAAAGLLLLPAIAMRFDSGVNWSASDFAVMGAMLFSACGAYELATRRSGISAYRAGVGVAILAAFLTVWVNLAVGMLGSEQNPANLLFGGVLAVGVIGAAFARLRPVGMARAMLATALAQAAMALYALVSGYADAALPIGAFVLPWLASAALFSKAGRANAAVLTTNA